MPDPSTLPGPSCTPHIRDLLASEQSARERVEAAERQLRETTAPLARAVDAARDELHRAGIRIRNAALETDAKAELQRLVPAAERGACCRFALPRTCACRASWSCRIHGTRCTVEGGRHA